ncbi:MAG: hypothetical protein JSV88_20580 [Candidatus Aminicenantes bacterium]|nr:MAG: hypothetical protein JSV88_20580 [Candidatus Aminicenantes bacterium]
MMNYTAQTNKSVEDYFSLIRNLPDEDKIELIARISNSIVEKRKLLKEEASKEEILAETYGCFESSKSADEIIDEIYSSRHFKDKNPDL